MINVGEVCLLEMLLIIAATKSVCVLCTNNFLQRVLVVKRFKGKSVAVAVGA